MHDKKQLYISRDNYETAQAVFDLIKKENQTFSDFVWDACRLALAHRGALPIAIALRPMIEEILENHLVGNDSKQPIGKPVSGDPFFNLMIEE